MSNTTVKSATRSIGCLGVGWIGRNRMEAMAASPYAQIQAIADFDNEALQAACQTIPQAIKCTSVDELLSQGLDGLAVATPSALHAEHTRKALEQGWAVFCQKPLGRNYEETRELVDLARAKNLLLGVDFSYRHTCYRNIHDLVQSGALGDIYAAELVFHNAYGPDKEWFYDPARAGGGCLMDLGVHLVDLLLWTLKSPGVAHLQARLLAGGKPLLDPESQVEDYCTATMELGNGTLASLACSWNLPAGKDADIRVVYYGTKGGAAFRNLNGSFYDFEAVRFHGTRTEVLFSGEDDWGGRAAREWVEQLAEGATYHPDVETVLEVAALLDKMYGRR